MERTIKEASVEGVRIKQKPTKHVVYAVKLTWSDGQVNVVSRRYSEFYDLMKKLTDKFEEGGKKGKDKIIPTLSGRKVSLLGNNTMKRLESVTSFTKRLFRLPSHISQSQIVHDFFKPTFADLQSSQRSTKRGKKGLGLANKQMKKKLVKEMTITGPVAFEEYYATDDFKNKIKGGLDLKKGQVVEVIEKNESGWWFVFMEGQHGWVPKSYLEHEDSDHEDNSPITFEPGSGEFYVTTKKYKAQQQDELSFDVGVHLQIIEKHNDGWWKATYCGREGMVPNNHLKLIGRVRSDSQIKADESAGGAEKKKIDNVKAKPFITNNSRKKSRSDLDDDTLKRLRLSTCTVPDENAMMDPSRGKSNADIPKIHLQIKTSAEGGWVPQDNIQRSASFGNEKKKGTNIKKNSSFSGGIFKSKKAENSVSSLADMMSKEFAISRSNSDPEIAPQNPTETERKVLSPLTVPQIVQEPAECERELPPANEHVLPGLQHQKVKRKAPSPPKGHTRLPSHKSKSLPRPPSSQVNNRKRSEDSSEQCHEQTHQQRRSLPNVGGGPEKQLQATPALIEWDAFNNLDEESSDSEEDSMEDIILTYEDLEREETERNDFRKDNGFSDSSSLPRSTNKVYIAKVDYNGIEENDEIDLSKGQQVVVLNKIKSGWWLVESKGMRGWAPSNYLVEFYQVPEADEDKIITNKEAIEGRTVLSLISESVVSQSDSGLVSMESVQSSNQADFYIAIANFNGVKEDEEVNLIKNHKVLVLQKASEWWLVESEGEVGWAPSNYLEEIPDNDEKKSREFKQLQIASGSPLEVLDGNNNC